MPTVTHPFALPCDLATQKILLGEYHAHLKQLQQRTGIAIVQHGAELLLTGEARAVAHSERVLTALAELAQACRSSGKTIDSMTVHLLIQSSQLPHDDAKTPTLSHGETPADDGADSKAPTLPKPPKSSPCADHFTPITLRTRKGNIIPRGENQQRYVRQILSSDVSFGIGPAGTGKTYLAVACAVDSLERNDIERLILVRPAVEAGEKLGFLPGDLTQKIDPYLRPLYDALYEMLGFEKVGKLQERQIIEVAPLAYMRGRTLNNAFVILDEAQNTTPEQMKMFLTRLGFGSRAVITGDLSQVDLPRRQQSGLMQALQVLANVREIHVTRFGGADVVRHQLVQKIVAAYDAFEAHQLEKKALEKKELSQDDDASKDSN